MPKDKLKPKEELFCQYYARSGQAFGNQTKSYALAFGKDFGNKKQSELCSSMSNRLLGKVKIYRRCEQLLNEKINNEVVDKELAKVIKQSENLHAKVSAISEYNKVRGRITTKHKFEGVSDEALTEKLAERLAGIIGDNRRTGTTPKGKSG
jgi:hypothetical protein